MMTGRTMILGTYDGALTLEETGENRWEPRRAGLSGKVVGSQAASREAHVLFCSVEREGVYASTDGGGSWHLALEGDVRCLAVDPGSPSTIYAGTEPVALYRSSDAGDSWSELGALRQMPEEVQEKWWFPQPPHEGHVCSIFVDPVDSRVIYLGLEHGGIVRTLDGGQHWEDVSAGIEYLDIHMVARDPARRGLFYAATARGFYRSEDEGRGWALSTQGMTRDYFHDFLVRPGAASSLFLATARGSPPAWLRPTGAEAAIYRSEDGGLTWGQLGGGLPSSLERMVWGLAEDPVDEGRLYAALADYPSNLREGATAGGEVWASLDQGDTWTAVYETASPVHSLCVTAG